MSKIKPGFHSSEEPEYVENNDSWVEGESIVPLYIQDVPDRSDDDISEGYAEDY